MKKRAANLADAVCVVGTGAATAVGACAAASAAAVRAGIAYAVDHPFMLDRECEPMVVASASYIDPELRGSARFEMLAALAAHDALAGWAGPDGPAMRIRLLVALPEDRPGLPRGLAGNVERHLARSLGALSSIESVRCLARGHAGGAIVLEQARREIADDPSVVCLVGGVDSYLDADTLRWLENNEQLHGPHFSWGFRPGEASGFCLLCSASRARQLGFAASVHLHPAGVAQEPVPIKQQGVCTGEGLTSAFNLALSGMGPPHRVTHTICDMNGEPYRADEYGFALLRTSEHFEDGAGFQTPAESWGDVGAASVPLFVMLAAEADKKGYAPGPASLLWASSEDGLRGACVVSSARSA